MVYEGDGQAVTYLVGEVLNVALTSGLAGAHPKWLQYHSAVWKWTVQYLTV